MFQEGKKEEGEKNVSNRLNHLFGRITVFNRRSAFPCSVSLLIVSCGKKICQKSRWLWFSMLVTSQRGGRESLEL